MTATVQLHYVSVQLGAQDVLRDLTLTLESGTRTSIIGASGVGKTTLLRALAGLVPIASGTVHIGGRDVTDTPSHTRQLGMVFQEPRLLPHVDAIDNVALPLRSRRISRTDRRRSAMRMLELVEVAHRATARPAQLSGGEQQRVALARALVHEPLVLVLDEPLSSVDAQLRGDLQRLIIDVQSRTGMTTLSVTHDRHEAAVLGQTTAVLVDGMIVQHAPFDELAMRPVTSHVARLAGSGVVAPPGSTLHDVVGRSTTRAVWVPAPALSVERVATGQAGRSLQVIITRIRMAAGGWVATLQLPDMEAEIGFRHGDIDAGDTVTLRIDESLVVELRSEEP